MAYIQSDYRDFLSKPHTHYDYLILDPPWRFDSKPPVLSENQLTYNLWNDNVKDLQWILMNTDADYIFLWTCNSIIDSNIKSLEGTPYRYKTMLTWVKQTAKGNLFWGLGNTFRNCTEQMIVLSKKKAKALNLNMRNVIFYPAGKRTIKPKEFEKELITKLTDKGLSGCYLFCGEDASGVLPGECCDFVDIV